MKRSMMLGSVLALACAAPGLAQEAPSPRQAEIAALEAMLKDADAALDALRPLVSPPLSRVHYDVGLLYQRPEDRAAPSLSIPSDAAGYRTGAGAPAAAGTLTFDEEYEEAGTGVEADRLIELIESKLGDEAEDGSLELANGQLIARKPALTHSLIRRLIADLKQSQLRCVQLEVGFYALPPALEGELTLASRQADGLLDAGQLQRLDEAVAAGRATLTRSGLLTALSGQRVFLHQGDERAYLSGYRQSSGGDQQVVTVSVPTVDVLQSGVALEMRAALVDTDSPRVALDVRFARLRVDAIAQRSTQWGPLDVPQVTSASVRTSARVPPGAGMLVYSARDGGEAQPLTIVVRPRLSDAE